MFGGYTCARPNSLWFVRKALPCCIVLVAEVIAQVPAPVQPVGSRYVHPTIADATGAILNGSSPHFQYADGIWNHGEGFSASTQDADQGGWFNEDDGSGLTLADIHATSGGQTNPYTPWHLWTWSSRFDSHSPRTLRRMVGYLRPAGLPLPTVHPLYGQLPSGAGPLGDGTYVDQAAFEIFAPVQQPTTGQKVVVVIYNWATRPFPRDYQDRVPPWAQYLGFFSPDGLLRREKAARSMQNFLDNTEDSVVDDVPSRPAYVAELVAKAGDYSATYYPITAYVVPSLAMRPTSLQEQRNMQLRQAVMLLLQNPSSPLSPVLQAVSPLDVTVVFAGGSNGGHQAMWSAMRFPDRIHGSYTESINPSIQRLFGEHDLGWCFGHLAGHPYAGATVAESDFLIWGQYCWNHGEWIHDISLPRRLARNQLYRPAFFRAGDEDITSTGTDWAGLIDQSGVWRPSGQSAPSTGPLTWNIPSVVHYSIAKNARHVPAVATVNPYTSQSTLDMSSITHELVNAAVANRTTEVSTTPPPVISPVVSQNRSSQLFGMDDPHEWALGRAGSPMAPSSSLLTEDRTWFQTVQPGAAGTWLGYKEAMLIRGGRLYVTGAAGVVTAFEVDPTPANRGRLIKVAQTHNPASASEPMSLGLESFALAAADTSTGWRLVVGTRRHLYLLDPTTLGITLGPVEIPWEAAQPHHMKVADVLPNDPGAEIIFASVHGGLVFYSLTLAPLYEWPEPGITDFVPEGTTVTILARGVVAKVSFATTPPQLLAASRPIPRRLQQYVAPSQYEEALDSPSQGSPIDLELMKFPGETATIAPVALWSGDEDCDDGVAVRAYDGQSLIVRPFATGILPHNPQLFGSDICTCKEGVNPVISSQHEPGDHLLVLHGDRLSLYDHAGQLLAAKKLDRVVGGNWYNPFGRQTLVMAVGELASGGTGIYDQEVVVTNQSGGLFWMHIEDLLASGDELGGDYTPVTGPGSSIQPRTNQSLSATWPMAQRSGDTSQLHLLDQRGGYWTVDAAGVVQLRDRAPEVVGMRDWESLGNINAAGQQIQLDRGSWDPFRAGVSPSLSAQLIITTPWCHIDPDIVAYESTPHYKPNQWHRGIVFTPNLAGFVAFPWGGTVRDSTSHREVWLWSAWGPWGNLIEGLSFALAAATPSATNWPIDGLWASTAHHPAGIGPSDFANQLAHWNLRNTWPRTPISSYQAMRAVTGTSGSTALILGLPGGRVRVMEPGTMGQGPNNAHTLGNSSVFVQSPDDLGFGGGALAVKQDTNVAGGSVQIWFGTVYGPTPRPTAYSGAAQGALASGELAAGRLCAMTWTPGGSGISAGPVLNLQPAAAASVLGPRGGYGVIGLCVADLLPEVPPAAPADELIVGTLAGDILVYDAGSMTLRWRTHVPGCVGYSNSIRVADLDSDGHKELYVAGSFGLWRFVEGGGGNP